MSVKIHGQRRSLDRVIGIMIAITFIVAFLVGFKYEPYYCNNGVVVVQSYEEDGVTFYDYEQNGNKYVHVCEHDFNKVIGK